MNINKNFSAPGGRSYLNVRSANADPSRRYLVTVSDAFYLGTGNIRELAAFLNAVADELDPPQAAASAAAEPVPAPAAAAAEPKPAKGKAATKQTETPDA